MAASEHQQARKRFARLTDQLILLPAPVAAGLRLKKVLVANRGEITVRICKAAKALGIKTVVVYTEQDDGAWHMKNPNVDEAVKLPAGATPIAPYLDIESIIKVCKDKGADCVHPGYGFLSENVNFVSRLEQEGIKFVGPTAKCIDLFGDKTAARAFAQKCGVPVLPGSPLCRSVAEATAFLQERGSAVRWPLLIKAAFGGGGRGQKVVRDPKKFNESFEACSKEAELGFGDGGCFIEEYLEDVRHIEIQLLGNGKGKCMTLFERDCSAQLRNQKVVEIAPARDMNPELRKKICDSAIQLGTGCDYCNAGTVEYLVSGSLENPDARFVFLEMNPRVQVEHTITEAVTGADIVQTQFLIASGADFPDLVQAGTLPAKPELKGTAFQLRVTATPGGGPLIGYSQPEGEGIRVDSGIVEGATVSMEYDPLLAKLIVHANDGWEACRVKSIQALANFKIEGPNTNRKLLDGILNHPRMKNNQMYTNFIDANKDELEGKAKKAAIEIGTVLKVQAPFPGQIAEVKVKAGDTVEAGDVLCVINAMKMMNDVVAVAPGIVREVFAEANAQVMDDSILCHLEVTGAAQEEESETGSQSSVIGKSEGGAFGASHAWYEGEPQALQTSSAVIRSKIKTTDATYKKRYAVNAERVRLLEERLAIVKQGGGEKAVRLLRSRGKMLPRERIQEIIDPGTKFLELSALANWDKEDKKAHSASIITGIGLVHGRECMFIANDSTVKGGAFGPMTLTKQTRAQTIALQNLLPTIYLVDGGGANLNQTDVKDIVPAIFVEGGRSFKNQALMSGKNIPQVAAVCGMCTAGAAYIPAMCDESIIVKGNGTVYLGGPPLVRAATGEIANEQDLGGGAMHTSQSGVVDHLAEDEPQALAMIRSIAEHFNTFTKYQPPGFRAAEPPKYDPEELLGIIPEENKFPFEMREVIARIVDGSRFHEFKPRYGPTLVCGFAHIEGYPVGILANNGMLFSQSALKGTHFIQLCGQRNIPLIFLHNITGFMIGTEFEKGGITKDGAKMITAVSCVNVPKFSIICAGSHGAGNYAMCGQAYDPRFTWTWPNGKISVMGGEQMVGTMASVRHNAMTRDGKASISYEDFMKQAREMASSMIEMYEEKSDAYTCTANVFDDGIIDPRQTRNYLARGLSLAMNAMKNESQFPDKFGVFRM
jgi:acetyl-CoA carboxylase carboxyltransferase component/acetyl/propionyl-CoA carboxylase alpha subunit